MDQSERKQPANPRENASVLSVLSFAWTWRMFRTGLSKTLDVEDLYEPLQEDHSNLLGDKLEGAWNAELRRAAAADATPSFLRAMLRAFGWEYLIIGSMQVFSDVGALRLVQPLLLGKLLSFFSPGSTVPAGSALLCAGGIVFCILLNVVSQNQSMYRCYRAGMRARIACCSLLYRKATRLALSDTASAGRMVNLLSNDVSRLDMASLFVNFLWTAPLVTALSIYLLYVHVGWAGFVGVGVVFGIAVLQSYTGKLSSRFRALTALQTDERVRLMTEIIAGVQVIKMYAWEKPFTALICESRRKEVREILRVSLMRGLFMSFIMFTTRVALFAALTIFTLTGGAIKAHFVFVVHSYLNTLSFLMGTVFARAVTESAECLVSFRRIQKFLLSEECESKSITKTPNGVDNPGFTDCGMTAVESAISVNGAAVKAAHRGGAAGPRVRFSNFSCRWSPSCSADTLRGISLTLHPGELLAVIGPVGAGKAVLREVPLSSVSGRLEVDAVVSYACQEPWLFAASIRQNITFGAPFHRERYDAVVHTCALLEDFSHFANGDLTLVGERGVSLSGGQKARVNLARALYREAELYLLDDPFAAVDANVGRHLFQECIGKFLAGKTTILVTHQVQYLRELPRIAVMNNGAIQMQGTFEEVLNSDIDYAEALRMAEEREKEQEQEQGKDQEEGKDQEQGGQLPPREQKPQPLTSLAIPTTSPSNGVKDICSASEKNGKSASMGQVEESSKGKVHGSLFFKYLRSGTNSLGVVMVCLLFLGAQTAGSVADRFVGFWTNQEELRVLPGAPPVMATNTLMYIYTGIIVTLFLVAFTRSLVFFALCMRGSQRLHDNMFANLIRSPMRFFHTSPSGRVLNRFSKDLGSVDELLPRAILDATQILLSMVGYIAVTVSINWLFIFPVMALLSLFYTARHVYLKTAKNVKRLEGMTRSPVFSHLSATIQGLSTVRAFNAQSILVREFDRHQDLHTSAWFMFIASNQSFGMALDTMSWFFIFIVTFSFLVLPNSAYGGDVGLAIAQSMLLTESVQFGMRQSAEVIAQLLSAERVLEYTQLPREPGLETGDMAPDPDWPREGRVELRHVTLRYGPGDPPALRDLSCTVLPGEKVGVVGRTGAGKSSLMAAMFRLVGDGLEGGVLLDGVDTRRLALQTLRTRISVIPQEPFLFSGTLRGNLDPFQEYADHQIWAALEDVELRGVASEAQGLDTRVAVSGSNFSVGQRQLLCLARAVLRANKVLLLDEPTANVDPQTDELIQRTIRSKFAPCTVLTVAHRLHTIMDSDKVLVMDGGRAVEFGHPHELLLRQGVFAALLQETGPQVAENLAAVARENYESHVRNRGNQHPAGDGDAASSG